MVLRMLEHNWEIGTNFKTTAWALQAAIEVTIEMDSRWMVDATIAEAKRDWKSLAINCASKLALANFKMGEVYGAKLLHEQPFLLWQARVRQPSEMVEKLMIASEREGCFVRTTNPQEVAEHQSFTIVWTRRNIDASAATLASFLSQNRITGRPQSLSAQHGISGSTGTLDNYQGGPCNLGQWSGFLTTLG